MKTFTAKPHYVRVTNVCLFVCAINGPLSPHKVSFLLFWQTLLKLEENSTFLVILFLYQRRTNQKYFDGKVNHDSFNLDATSSETGNTSKNVDLIYSKWTGKNKNLTPY